MYMKYMIGQLIMTSLIILIIMFIYNDTNVLGIIQGWNRPGRIAFIMEYILLTFSMIFGLSSYR